MMRCKEVKKIMMDNPESGDKDYHNHLKRCDGCRKDFEILNGMFSGFEQINLELDTNEEKINWDDVTSRILKRIEEKASRKKRFSYLKLITSFAAGMALIIIGFVVVLTILRQAPEKTMNKESIELIEAVIAQNNILNYLDETKLVFSDIMNYSQQQQPEQWQFDLSIGQARKLLEKRCYFKDDLEGVRLANAKDLVHRIDFICYEMIQLKGIEDQEKLEFIQEMIQREKLFLKINLVRTEIMDTGV